MVGEETWMDRMGVEIITVQNSEFTCRGKQGSIGGSNIDYFVISKCLVALVVYLGGGARVALGTPLWLNPNLLRKAKRHSPSNIGKAIYAKERCGGEEAEADY